MMNGRTILIVDDEIPIAEMFRMILDAAGYKTQVAHKVVDALAVLKAVPVDLIILDIMMPGESGLDFIKDLRKDSAFTDLPVIFVSAKSRPDDVDEGMLAGASAYLTKPVSRIELLNTVADALDSNEPR
ncbi:MAG: response regulator [Anaerolineales bacterium]|nr:response regulator [Anaerolineales bacterium]